MMKKKKKTSGVKVKWHSGVLWALMKSHKSLGEDNALL